MVFETTDGWQRIGSVNRKGLLALPAFALLAACGSASGPVATQAQPTARPDPRQAVLASVAKTSATSFLADMTVSVTVTATGGAASSLGALGGQAFTGTMQMSEESPRRMRLRIDATAAARSARAVAVLYDGTLYISSNGGATFTSRPLSTAVTDQFASTNTLSYIQSVATVTDEGPGTADGVAVERYSAKVDGAKVLTLIQTELGSVPSAAQTLFKSISFDGGALEVTIDHQGRIVTEHGPIDASVDLSTLGASLAGTRLTIHEVIDGHFHDYGSAVTVTRPNATAVASS